MQSNLLAISSTKGCSIIMDWKCAHHATYIEYLLVRGFVFMITDVKKNVFTYYINSLYNLTFGGIQFVLPGESVSIHDNIILWFYPYIYSMYNCIHLVVCFCSLAIILTLSWAGTVNPGKHNYVWCAQHHISTEAAAVYPSVHPSMDPSVHPFIHPWIHRSIRPSIHGSIGPSVHPSMDPSVHPSIYPWSHSSFRPYIHGFIHPSV